MTALFNLSQHRVYYQVNTVWHSHDQHATLKKLLQHPQSTGFCYQQRIRHRFTRSTCLQWNVRQHQNICFSTLDQQSSSTNEGETQDHVNKHVCNGKVRQPWKLCISSTLGSTKLYHQQRIDRGSHDQRICISNLINKTL
jgi:hypothetical protein